MKTLRSKHDIFPSHLLKAGRAWQCLPIAQNKYFDGVLSIIHWIMHLVSDPETKLINTHDGMAAFPTDQAFDSTPQVQSPDSLEGWPGRRVCL